MDSREVTFVIIEDPREFAKVFFSFFPTLRPDWNRAGISRPGTWLGYLKRSANPNFINMQSDNPHRPAGALVPLSGDVEFSLSRYRTSGRRRDVLFPPRQNNLPLTLTFPYFHVKNTMTGRKRIMTHDRTRIIVLITQFSDTTQGRLSIQDSHPSAHDKHSNMPAFSYWFSSPWKKKGG